MVMHKAMSLCRAPSIDTTETHLHHKNLYLWELYMKDPSIKHASIHHVAIYSTSKNIAILCPCCYELTVEAPSYGESAIVFLLSNFSNYVYV